MLPARGMATRKRSPEPARAPSAAHFTVAPPLEPMLAKSMDAISRGELAYEPKWDGFRAIVFRHGGNVLIQSRYLRPLDRYFPELHDACLAALPEDCVVEGEIVIVQPHGLDFDLLQ